MQEDSSPSFRRGLGGGCPLRVLCITLPLDIKGEEQTLTLPNHSKFLYILVQQPQRQTPR